MINDNELPSMAPMYSTTFSKDITWDIGTVIDKITDGKWGNTLEYYKNGQVEINNYPFKGAVGRTDELKYFSKLLGISAKAGHTILLTGFRGTGKTSFVNQAIYNMSLLGHGQVYFDGGELKKETEELYDKDTTLEYEKIDNFYDNFKDNK